MPRRKGCCTTERTVVAWAKNEHLGFEITYSYKGVIRKVRPDYLVRLANGKMLVLEVKGWTRKINGRSESF
jgi:hypothetical protein